MDIGWSIIIGREPSLFVYFVPVLNYKEYLEYDFSKSETISVDSCFHESPSILLV